MRLVWEGCREGGREITAASSKRNGAGAARKGNAAKGKWHGEDQHACYNTTFFAAFVAATASSPTPPPPIHLRISVALLAPKAFLATAFLMLGSYESTVHGLSV